MSDNKMTAEQAIKELLRALWKGKVAKKRPSVGDVNAMIDLAYTAKKALSAPRVPAGWNIQRSPRGELVIIVSKNDVGGYAARQDGRSGIAESILYHLCDDMLTASPEPVAPDDTQQVIADLRAEVEALRDMLCCAIDHTKNGDDAFWLNKAEFLLSKTVCGG